MYIHIYNVNEQHIYERILPYNKQGTLWLKPDTFVCQRSRFVCLMAGQATPSFAVIFLFRSSFKCSPRASPHIVVDIAVHKVQNKRHFHIARYIWLYIVQYIFCIHAYINYIDISHHTVYYIYIYI